MRHKDHRVKHRNSRTPPGSHLGLRHRVPAWNVTVQETSREDVQQLYNYIDEGLNTFYNAFNISQKEIKDGAVKGFTWVTDTMEKEFNTLLENQHRLKEVLDGKTKITTEQMREADKVFGSFRFDVQEAIHQQAANLQAVYNKVEESNKASQDMAKQFETMMARQKLYEARDHERELQMLHYQRQLDQRLNDLFDTYDFKARVDEHIEASLAEQKAQFEHDRAHSPQYEPRSPTAKPEDQDSLYRSAEEDSVYKRVMKGERNNRADRPRNNNRGIPNNGNQQQPPQHGGNGGNGGKGGNVGAGAGPAGDPSDSSSSDEDEYRIRKLKRRTDGHRSPKKEHHAAIQAYIVDNHKKYNDTPAPDPWKYSGASKEDLREWLSLCEDYFVLRASKFKEEVNKVTWARFQVKEGSKAMQWATDYIRRMKDGEHSFRSWDRFKEEIQSRFLSTQEGSEALSEMQRTVYRHDIAQYVIRMESLNRLAKLTGPGLRDIVKRGLPTDINRLHDLKDDTEDDGQFWKDIQWAGKKQEATDARIRSWGRGERSGSGGGYKPNDNHRRKSDDVTKPKRDNYNRVSKTTKPNDKGNKPVRSYKDAIAGVPEDVLKQRRTDRVCLRCGKEGHACAFCTCRQPVISAISTKKKYRAYEKNDKPVYARSASKYDDKKVAAVTQPRIWDFPSEDVDMVDYSVSDGERDF